MSGQGALRRVEGAKQRRGFVIYRASRLEALLPALRELMDATPPVHVLAPQRIIAAHPGIQQWLNGALAREYGLGGIAANLDVLLPSSWIDQLALTLLETQAVSLPNYQRQHLRWTIHELLQGDIAALGLTDARVVKYLDTTGNGSRSADAARRRFQLAERLAAVFSRYLVYRPDWLRAWERGDRAEPFANGVSPTAISTETELLAPLWKELSKKLGQHRGDVVDALISELNKENDADVGPQAALHVFGISHLAPSELAVLRAFSRHRLVAMYVPDPCQKYWGGPSRELPLPRQKSRDEVSRIEAAQGNEYWDEQDHPLLARWGRMGRHFIMALADGEADVLEDVRHWQDEQPEPPHNRLSRVQESIRQLDVSLMESDPEEELGDRSLLVHACHTPLRELEVLRDQLLDALETPDANGELLRPSDIVVMAPNIQTYVPLIPSVFGIATHSHASKDEPEPAGTRKRLPYHLADVAVARTHTLLGAFQRLLELPGTRVTAPEVMDLLMVPEVARRLNIDEEGVEELREWLQRSRVAWALDPEFREGLGVPPIAEHTFGWAMDRMLAGYIMADASTDELQPPVTLPDGTELAPLTAIHGPAASHLGALDHLLRELQSLISLAGQTLRASEWAKELETRFDALFRIDFTDADARLAKSAVLRLIGSLAVETEAAGEDPELHFAVVRDLLLARLSAVPEQQDFLMGGITFCGMVPQRAIPFKVVAVLGLNDGEFPRTASESGLDLMARFRRLGDRDVRLDDRYLFLETLMSARERLHLSYIGEGVRDGKPRNPSAPLAELLGMLEATSNEESSCPWHVRHPLQAFDGRYFDSSDERLFSYNHALAAMHGKGNQRSVPVFRDVEFSGVTVDEDSGNELNPVVLREVADYYRNPARNLLRNHLQVSLDALEDTRLRQSEPLDPKFDAMDMVTSKLFFNDALKMAQWPPDSPPAWVRLSGLLPPGRPGEKAWKAESDYVGLLLETVRRIAGLEKWPNEPINHAIDVNLRGQRLTGQIENVFVVPGDTPVWHLLRIFSSAQGELKKESALTFRERVPLFLDWALLRLQTARTMGAAAPAVRLQALVSKEGGKGRKSEAAEEAGWLSDLARWDEAFIAHPDTRDKQLEQLEKRILQIVRWSQQGRMAPRWYFPQTAWAALVGKDGEARSKWEGSSPSGGERDYQPGYTRLLAGDVDFAPDSDELQEMIEFSNLLNNCISLVEDGAEDTR